MLSVFGPRYHLRMWLVFIGASAVTDGGIRAADMSRFILFSLSNNDWLINNIYVTLYKYLISQWSAAVRLLLPPVGSDAVEEQAALSVSAAGVTAGQSWSAQRAHRWHNTCKSQNKEQNEKHTSEKSALLTDYHWLHTICLCFFSCNFNENAVNL